MRVDEICGRDEETESRESRETGIERRRSRRFVLVSYISSFLVAFIACCMSSVGFERC